MVITDQRYDMRPLEIDIDKLRAETAAFKARLAECEEKLVLWRAVGIICKLDIQKYAPLNYAELKAAGEME